MTKSLLLIDDDPDLGRILGRLLEYRGFTVLLARTAEAALALLEKKPDAILLDIVLGPDNGWDLLPRLRERTDRPIFVMTGAGADEEIRRDAIALGAQGVLAKPFNERDVIAALEKRGDGAT